MLRSIRATLVLSLGAAAAAAAAGEAAVGEVREARERELLAMDDGALIDLYSKGARAAADIGDLLFMREVDPARYLDVSMAIKSERSKTAEEEVCAPRARGHLRALPCLWRADARSKWDTRG